MILIIQIGLLSPLIKYYLEEDFQIIKAYHYEYVGNILENIDLDKYDKIIILGGHQSILNIKVHRSLRQVIKLIEKCFEINKKVIGICLGAQLIAYFRGCEIKKLNKPKIGFDANVIINNKIFNDIFRYHHDYIVPNNNIEVLSEHENIPYFIKSKSLIGIQCHPDILPSEVDKFVDPNKLNKKLLISIEEMNIKNKELLNELLNYQ